MRRCLCDSSAEENLEPSSFSLLLEPDFSIPPARSSNSFDWALGLNGRGDKFKSSSTVCFSSGYGFGRPSIVISYPASRSQGEALVAFHHPRWISCCGQKTRGRRSSRVISVVRTRLSRKSTPLSQDGRHHEHLRRRQGCQGPQGTHGASVASPSRSRFRHPSDGCPWKIPPKQIK